MPMVVSSASTHDHAPERAQPTRPQRQNRAADPEPVSAGKKLNLRVVERLTGTLIRRLLLFFGIFFELLPGSINVLPIFQSPTNTHRAPANKLLFQPGVGAQNGFEKVNKGRQLPSVVR